MTYTRLLRSAPVLAFCSSFQGPIPCNLSIKHSKSRGEASIYLAFIIHVRGFEEPQRFQLTYNADIWEALYLVRNRDLAKHQLAGIRRKNTDSALKTLSLSLRQPCTVQCLPSPPCFAEKPGHELEFDQLRQIAREREIDLLFDTGWVDRRNYADFFQLVISPGLAGVPTETSNKSLSRQTDWTVFGPLQDNVPDAPPSYTAASAEPPGTGRSKRRRDPSPEPPAFVPGSPTEKATPTTASPSCPSPLYASNLEQIVETTVEAKLARLFDVDCDPPPIAARIAAHILAYVKKEANKLCADTLDEAFNIQATVIECSEQLDDHKAELADAKEGYIDELQRCGDTAGEEIRDSVEVIKEEFKAELSEHVDSVCDKARGRVEDALKQEGRMYKAELSKHVDAFCDEARERLKDALEQEERRHTRTRTGSVAGQDGRAASL